MYVNVAHSTSEGMTIRKPRAGNMQQTDPHRVNAPSRKASQFQLDFNQVPFKDIYKLLHEGDQVQDINTVNQADWDSMLHDEFNAESCGEHVEGLLEDQERSAYLSSTTEVGYLSQLKQLDSHLVIHQESEDKGAIYMQRIHNTGHFDRAHAELANHTTLHQTTQAQTHYDVQGLSYNHAGAIEARPFGKFGLMIQQAEKQAQASVCMRSVDQLRQPCVSQSQAFSFAPEGRVQESQGQQIPCSCSTSPDVRSCQDNLVQNDTIQRLAPSFPQGISVGTSEREPTTCFPSQISSGTESWMDHDSAVTRPFTGYACGPEAIQCQIAIPTHDAHQMFPSYDGPVSNNIQGKSFPITFGISNTDCSAHQTPVTELSQNGHAIQEQWTSTCNPQSFSNELHACGHIIHSTQPTPACAPEHTHSSCKMAVHAPTSVYQFSTLASSTPATITLHHSTNANADPAQSSFLERISYDNSVWTSSFQNMKGLDALSSTAAGDQLPSVCSSDAAKSRPQRLTIVRNEVRNSHTDDTSMGKVKITIGGPNDAVGNGKESRLTAVRSEIRNGGHINSSDELLAEGEPQRKQRKKKIRCRVQKEQAQRRGRRKSSKAKDVPRGAELHGHERSIDRDYRSAEAAISSVGETTPSPEVAPFVVDGQAGFALTLSTKPLYGEECGSAWTTFPINGNEIHSWNEQSNVITNYGIGRESEKPPLVDYFALSEARHRAGAMDFTASSSTQELQWTSLGCQDLVLYDQAHQQSQSKELPLCLFSGEASYTGSTDLVPASQGRFDNLPLAKVNPQDNLQLVLYNQKRDIVVSRVRTSKKIRAKVQLDPESQRVWLLLENGAAPQPDNDPGKVRYWEQQRGDMRRKVEHFIKKMHNVQGDRKFSPWKGSIVDSVVGAFLTQNVSDHLSSSAFMSVASRFPPLSRSNTLVAHSSMMGAFRSENTSEVETLPSIMRQVCFSSKEKGALGKEGDSDYDNRLYDSEIMAAEVGLGEVLQIQVDDRLPVSLSSNDIKQMYPSYTNAFITTPDSQTFGKKQQYHLLASDDERNSTCAVEEDANDVGRLEEISGTFLQQCTIRSDRARRMLNFGTELNKQQPELCSSLEPNQQVGLALMHATETAFDNISDQQSESESAVGSFGSVHSVQDSNFQVSIVQEGNLEVDFQANTFQASNRASSREVNDASRVQIDSKTNKKRPMSLSSISGMERAVLEANQKGRKKNHHKDWESVRKQALGISPCSRDNLGGPEPRSSLHEDSVNWDAVRLTDLGEFADAIKERGMHHVLSGRIKAFLTSLYEDHGSIDLEWLRNLPSEKAREYLMSVHGLGVKSVECIRLLTLHHLAFPVDTNVGRICVRLGWVPIEPLPEEVQLHLVELYPIQETIQRYLWPRLCTLDQRTLYELHYQLITFGKVFCTKSKPNCNACPLRTECKHFASAYASAKPLLTGPKQDESNRICSGTGSKVLPVLGMDAMTTGLLEYPKDKAIDLSLYMEAPIVSEIDSNTAFSFEYHQPLFGASYRDFYVEEPASPERAFEDEIMDIEDMGRPVYIYNNYEDYSIELLGDNLPLDYPDQSHVSIDFSKDTKDVNIQSTDSASTLFNPLTSVLSNNLCSSRIQSNNTELASKMPCHGSQSMASHLSTAESSYSTDLVVEVAQNAIVPVPEAAQIPAPKLKSIGRLRTVHYVYEIPDNHSLLKMVEVDAREKDDPCCYLLAIWSPGEIPESQQEIDELCRDDYSTHCVGSADETVAGTLLIPCRTAMHGSFPLNGTYFQVNEVFADHASSLRPLQVPRSLIWSLRRRFVYFGTSVPNIFKGLSTDEIKDCFWRGHVCVRGFDRRTRAPKPLVCRLHFPISKQQQKPSKSQGRKRS